MACDRSCPMVSDEGSTLGCLPDEGDIIGYLKEGFAWGCHEAPGQARVCSGLVEAVTRFPALYPALPNPIDWKEMKVLDYHVWYYEGTEAAKQKAQKAGGNLV